MSNVVWNLATRSAACGVTTRVFTGDKLLTQRTRTPGYDEAAPGLSVEVFSTDANAGMKPNLRRAVADLGPGAVAHVHAGFSSFADIAMQCLKARGVPYVYSPHGKLSAGNLANRKRLKHLYLALQGRRLINGAARIGLFSEGESGELSRLGITPEVVTIPNGFEPPDEAWGDERPAAFPDPYFLFLGHLFSGKQPELLIRAYAQSSSRGHCKLVFVGPDSYGHLDHLKAVVQSLGLEDDVIFYGAAFGREKFALLAAAVALFLPSLAEGMPLVLSEAVGAGTPAIFSVQSNGGFIARAGAGVEISGFEPERWAREMDRLVQEPDHREALAAGARRLAPELSWDRLSDRWLDLYKHLGGST